VAGRPRLYRLPSSRDMLKLTYSFDGLSRKGKVLDPPPHHLPPQLVRCIRKYQEEMLEAWDRVVILQ
jgi:hypothetical protein